MPHQANLVVTPAIGQEHLPRGNNEKVNPHQKGNWEEALVKFMCAPRSSGVPPHHGPKWPRVESRETVPNKERSKVWRKIKLTTFPLDDRTPQNSKRLKLGTMPPGFATERTF